MSLAQPRWLRHPSDRAKDVALALLVALPVVGASIHEAIQRHHGLWVLLGVAAVLPLLFRRQHPVAALAAIVLIGLALPSNVILDIPAMVALYRVASWRSLRITVAGVLAILGASVLHQLAWGTNNLGELLGAAVLCGIAVATGFRTAARRAQMDTLRERAERLDRERELMADQAVSEERVRIARELHDVVAHNVSLMVVQAQALGATVAEPPVVEATDGIADLGRQVMAEMHRTLRLLRAEEEAGEQRAPRPGLGNLDRLLEQSRAAGVSVDLTVEGAPRPLSESLDLSAFRIVQEALTNVRKHAGGADTRVTVGYGAGALELTIRNAAGSEAATNGARGHGLMGMRERVALFGGTLVAEPLDGHGYEVHAVLPYGEDPRT